MLANSKEAQVYHTVTHTMSSSIYEEHDDTILYTLKELGIIKAAGPVPKHNLYRGKKERKEKKERFFFFLIFYFPPPSPAQ